jgi:hypothetical protein
MKYLKVRALFFGAILPYVTVLKFREMYLCEVIYLLCCIFHIREHPCHVMSISEKHIPNARNIVHI